MTRTQTNKTERKVLQNSRSRFGLGILCLFVVGSLFIIQMYAAVRADVGTPSAYYMPKDPANIQAGTFSPEGNFSNAAVAKSEETQKSEEFSDPSDLLTVRSYSSPGSDELATGKNGQDDVLPETAAMEIAPVSKQAGVDAASILQGNDQPEGALPGTETLPGSDVSVPDPLSAAKQENGLTSGNEHEGKTIVDVQIVGNERHTTEKIMQQIHMRQGHVFKSSNLDDDILRLNQSRLFTLVEPYIRSVSNGVIVIFKVQERPVMRYLRFQGNGGIRVGILEKECGLVAGKPFSPYDVEEGRKKIETYYHTRGYARVSVKTIQGDQKGDPGVIYLINPGPKLRIGKTVFIGNKITSSARLKTVIQSKPGFLWLFKGELQEEILQNDIRTLEDYYRRLGFFYARIGRRVIRTSESGWNDVTFVINEGPQAYIREIRFVGNEKFDAATFLEDLKIEEGKPYNKDRLDLSIVKVRRRYGREGYVFANINAEAKILDDPGQCDIVFAIQEGKTYRVGRVNVLIEGEFPHTQISTVLNRLSVKPGDLVNVNELQDSERRLRASQLFATDAAQGKMPKIVYAPPELAQEAEVAAQIGSNAGGEPGGSGTTEHRKAESGSAGSAASSAGKASVGGGAGHDAVTGTHTVLKQTIADVEDGFQLGQNEAFLDVNIHTVMRPKETSAPSIETGPEAADSDRAIEEHSGSTELRTNTEADVNTGNVNSNISAAELEKYWCMEFVDRETGKTFRTYEFPESDADLYLDGRVSVSNDDPSYASRPVTFHETSQPVTRVVHYINTDASPAMGLPEEGGAIPLMEIEVTEDDLNEEENDHKSVYWGGKNEPNSVEQDAQSSVGQSAKSTVSGNLPNAPAWASKASAEAAPSEQVADVNQQTGQMMAPPPQPGISNTDVTPYTQHISDPPADGYTLGDWQRQSLPITAEMEETTTGRVMFSLGVSSDSGLVGSVVVDEQNFDIRRWPTKWSDIKNGTSWRGRGQHFRLEATPGTEVSRYVVSFDEPYLFNSQIGLGTSAMYYERDYKPWDERRIGGQFNLSRALTHDMRAYIGFRGYDVNVYNPCSPTPDRVRDALGHSQLYGFSLRLVQDRRDSSFLATEGYYASLEFEQVIGSYVYPRFNAQFKKYWLLHERADMSGRNVLSFTSSFAWTGDNTPIYESYFAGGSSTIRGFEYRGVSPRQYGYVVGGNVMLLASLEYLFPITADDMIRGVVFCDTGTVESDIKHWSSTYRVTVGAGFRISMPMLGPAPMALDFGVPVCQEGGDEKELFSFTMGLQR